MCVCVRKIEREGTKNRYKMGAGGGGGVEDVFFSCLSLQETHKHMKLCISVMIICKPEYQLYPL